MSKMPARSFFANRKVEPALARMAKSLLRLLPDGSFAEHERKVLEMTNEIGRLALEEALQSVADSFPERVAVDGRTFKEHEAAEVTYHGLSGPLRVRRSTYRECGVHNGPTIVPTELVAGIAERATPALAFNILHGYAQHDSRLHCEMMQAAERIPPSRATLERMAQQIGGKAVEQAPVIERVLRRHEKPPEDACGIVVGLDRTSVPMMEEADPQAPQRKPKERRKPRIRRAPKPFEIKWRMAYVATVSFVNEYGESLKTYRYAAPACDDPRPLVDKMMADVAIAVRQNPVLAVGIVQDGAPEMWSRVREGMQSLKQRGSLDRWHEAIDRFHLLEHLGAALEAAEKDSDARRSLLKEWNSQLDKRSGAIDDIEAFLQERLAVMRDTPAGNQLSEHLGYVTNNKDRMRYVKLRNAGLPVGSGVTESAAKTVIGQRAKGSGQRWRERGLRNALTLRALHQSGRLPRFWTQLSRCYVANVREAA